MTLGITPAQQAALARIAAAVGSDAYLAGGIAVALRFGHRVSVDLDVFVPSADPALLAEPLAAAAGIRVIARAPGTLHLEVDDVPASLLRYRYPLLAPTERVPEAALPLASLSDLACMKLSAIAGRGAAKDFWDLHEILVRGDRDLAATIELYRRKYASEDVGHVIRSLAYFADADAAPLPQGLDPSRWQQIRTDFARWVRAL